MQINIDDTVYNVAVAYLFYDREWQLSVDLGPELPRAIAYHHDFSTAMDKLMENVRYLEG